MSVARVRRPRAGVVMVGCALVGLIYGAGTSILNNVGPGVLSSVLGHGAAWAGLGLVVAWVLREKSLAVWLCVVGVVVTFAVASIAYYVSDILFFLPGTARLQHEIATGVLPPLPEGSPVKTVDDLVRLQAREALYWVTQSVLLGGPVALVGIVMARADVVGLIARLAGPLALVAFMFLTLESTQNRVITLIVVTVWVAWIVTSSTVRHRRAQAL